MNLLCCFCCYGPAWICRGFSPLLYVFLTFLLEIVVILFGCLYGVSFSISVNLRAVLARPKLPKLNLLNIQCLKKRYGGCLTQIRLINTRILCVETIARSLDHVKLCSSQLNVRDCSVFSSTMIWTGPNQSAFPHWTLTYNLFPTFILESNKISILRECFAWCSQELSMELIERNWRQ